MTIPVSEIEGSLILVELQPDQIDQKDRNNTAVSPYRPD
jgi:hypothetical protein